MLSYSKQIENRLNEYENGKVFIANDFLDLASYETVRKTLNRFVDDEKISRIINGFYYNPAYNSLIQEYEAPSVHELALAIARKYNWDIAPYSSTALNLLGLSTQVPSSWKYISSGRYKEYKFGKNIIEFKKVRPAEIANMSLKTATVIQAIKALGKSNITEETINKIKKSLSKEEKTALMSEATSTSAWIYEVIRKISED
ncbi:MAG: hypothetical protein GX337_01220 [Christensenellaceae bacterium]|nr:hypothetical protein [Christensenellaceae bacterium]